MRAGLAFGAATGGSLVADGKTMDPMMSALVRFVRKLPPKPQQDIKRLRADYAALLELTGLRADPGVTAVPLKIPGLPLAREYVAQGQAPQDHAPQDHANRGTLLYFHGGGFIMGSTAALRAAGRRVELLEEDGLVHGFADFAGMVPAARRAVDRVVAGVRAMT